MMILDFVSLFLIVSLASAFEDQKETKAKPGEDATLQCQGPKNATITLLQWSKHELKSDDYVFFYRNSRSYENYQHQSYRGRVELRDRSSVKDGDVSVILKNVSINDTGTYECRIISSITISGERVRSELRHLINLTVTDSGDTAENAWDGGNKDGVNKDGGNEDGRHNDGGNKDKLSGGVIVGIVVFTVVLVGVVVFLGVMNYRKCKGPTKKDSYRRPAEKEIEPV